MPPNPSPSYAELSTWIRSLPLGKLQVTLPLPVSTDDADEIEQLFALVMRRIRRTQHANTLEDNTDAPR